jgi:hypothetical protein
MNPVGGRAWHRGIPAVPPGATVSGIDRWGSIEHTAGGTVIEMPTPIEPGRYEVKLNGFWHPPVNSPAPPHPDVPAYYATWVFAIETAGNPKGIFLEPPSVPPEPTGISAVCPNQQNNETTSN